MLKVVTGSLVSYLPLLIRKTQSRMYGIVVAVSLLNTERARESQSHRNKDAPAVITGCTSNHIRDPSTIWNVLSTRTWA